ncbi:phthiocerol/phthiodiolone dimycocerosyl transferase family protein [Nocardia iowensis]|uniref:Phthiocerol/phthiodiolone dimycocerosyl transferase C-terminal domain-containing protein n=1 Tax=Nocardia iowensis TaxID=204891 RepID=A0ABX8RZF3_NOCIO|nr:hypothetical protein [Nocardia iowensis]QXN92941.1 hypothetical protein KV110_07475 [Nocardia iowensis]
MTTSTVIRPLAPSEQIFAGTEVYVGYGVLVSGRLDLAALSAAYEAVVCAYPVLGARLEPTEDGGYVLVSSAGVTPEISVVDGDPERLLVDPKFDQSVALSAVCVVRDGDTASVTLMTHHSVADAYHSLAVLAELWSCYTDAVAGRPLERAVRPYPRSVEDLLAERGIEKMVDPNVAEPPGAAADESAVPESIMSDSTVPESGHDDLEFASLRTARCHLSVAETTALVELGHREGVTINGLVSAAVLLSEAEVLQLPLTDILFTYPVDLRSRITPTVGLTDGTNVLGFANYIPQETTGLLDLARGICESLRTSLAAGIVQQTPLHIPDMAASEFRLVPGMVIVTNWGRVPDLRAPEGLRLTDFRSTLTAKPDRITMRRAEAPGGGACIVSTFGGRLSIEIHHLESNIAQQQRRIDGISAKLRAAIS